MIENWESNNENQLHDACQYILYMKIFCIYLPAAALLLQCCPMTTNHKLLYNNNKLCINEWADDFVSAIVLWFECFIAAGLSPGLNERKKRGMNIMKNCVIFNLSIKRHKSTEI